MTTITLPPDLETRLADEAARRGTTPELLALESLRQLFSSPPDKAWAGHSLLDFIAQHVGIVNGTTEPLSENCGQRFADGLAADQQARDGLNPPIASTGVE
jgi:hypothetical protein